MQSIDDWAEQLHLLHSEKVPYQNVNDEASPELQEIIKDPAKYFEKSLKAVEDGENIFKEFGEEIYKVLNEIGTGIFSVYSELKQKGEQKQPEEGPVPAPQNENLQKLILFLQEVEQNDVFDDIQKY